jgi:hypothetical protein
VVRSAVLRIAHTRIQVCRLAARMRLPLIFYVGIFALLAVGFGGLQTHRLKTEKREHAEFRAQVKAAGEAAELAAKVKTEQDLKLAKEKNDEAQRRYAALATRHKRLLDSPGRNVLPPVTAAGDPNLACFNRTELAGALGRFVEGVAGLALEGDQAIAAINIGREWARELMRK